ncbi:MAG: peptidylprolyl isomerase [Chitinophagaceae bacterium]
MKKYTLFSLLLLMIAGVSAQVPPTIVSQPPATAVSAIQKVAPDTTQRVVADKILAIVGDKIILSSEITNEIADIERRKEQVPENAHCAMLEQALAMKALVMQAEKDSLVVSDEELEGMLDNRVRAFVSQFGSKEALEQVAGRTVYQLKEDFRQPIKESKLAELMRNKIVSSVKITPTEVKAYYDKIPKDSLAFYESEIEIGEIIAYPKASRDLEKYAIDELNDYKQQVESGSRKFETLASLYSDDPGSKDKGGLYTLNRTEKSTDPTFLSAAFRLKDGQVSPVIKSKFGYHIIQMVNRSGDDATVRHILKIPQVTDAESNGAIAKLDSVRSYLTSNVIQFGEAVARYSEDETSKFTGGMKQCINGTYCTIDQLDKDLALMLDKLKVGEYSKPVPYADERGKKGVRIVYLKSRSEPHRENLKDDYNKVASRAIEEKKYEAIERWFASKISTYYIMIDDEARSCSQLSKWFTNAAKN